MSSSDLRHAESSENFEAPRPMAELLQRYRVLRAEQTRLLDEVRSNDRRLRTLARRSWKIEEEERRRLAREIHDGIGQLLTALKNELGRLAGGAAAPGAADLEAVMALAAEALEETRELSRSLRPAVLDDLGLEPALRSLARRLGERSGFTVELRVDGPIDGVPEEVETLLYRVAQEALTNAIRHSGAAGATLRVSRRADRIRLRVSDAGVGCRPEEVLVASHENPGIGLHGIRDRMALFGGRFEFDSAPGAGTTLTIELSLTEVPE